MKHNPDAEFIFDTQLNCADNKCGVLSAEDADGTISVCAPPVFGGEGRPWTPEHLFLGALSSCFMTTFHAFAKKADIAISRLECNATGNVKLIDGKLKFTRVDLYPIIHIEDEALCKKIHTVLERTAKYCLISASVNAEVIYHNKVLANSGIELEEKEILC